MNEKERSEMIAQICDYILLSQFDKHEVDVLEALTVLASVSDQIIRSICKVMDMDAEEMLINFCNALQQPLQKERHYMTGDKDADELLSKIVAEMKDGGDIGKIVDKYVDCVSPELRQELIDQMTALGEIAYMNEHKFEMEREAMYKQLASNCSLLEVGNAIYKIKKLKK